jgi:hypothetical protein
LEAQEPYKNKGAVNTPPQPPENDEDIPF